MSLHQVRDVEELEAALSPWREEGIAFVPTMGNLHAGHLALVARARELAPRVVVSIFVNPLQFGPGEDYQRYPRTLEADRAKLAEAGVDLLFAPPVEVMYPRPLEEISRIHVPRLSEILCGAHRPGHFDGVATVVARLFNLVRPAHAVFGEKDYQQLLIIRRMVADLAIPVTIHGVATVREADGLAMSSRNQYLDPEERARAPALYRTLKRTAEALRAGRRDYPELEREATQALLQAGFRAVDYFAILDAEDLTPPRPGRPLAVLAAAHLGKARLIDNVRVPVPSRD